MGNSCNCISKEESEFEAFSKDPKKNIALIVKVQAAMRMYMANKKVHQIRKSRGISSAGMGAQNRAYAEGENIEPNYDNPLTMQIQAHLGPYQYGSQPRDDVKRETRPVQILENKAKYEGQWNSVTNQRDGQGKQVWPDGSVYEGFWNADKANGQGRLIHADGDVYEGDWKNDKAHGFGIYTHMDGA